MPEQETPADDVGESIQRSGEDVVKEDGKEAGRNEDGTSTARDTTSIDPQEPVTGSPPMGGQGG